MAFLLWWNKEILPTYDSRQKRLFLHLPHLYKWGFKLDTQVGYLLLDRSNGYDAYGVREWQFKILGFGFVYTENWDG